MQRSVSHQLLTTTGKCEDMHSPQQWTRTWIESILQQPLPMTNLFLCLKDGIILCRLMNKLQPGVVQHIYYNECVTAKEENIRQFLQAGSKMGLQDDELFYVHDLLQGKDMNAVMWTLKRLANLMNAHQQTSWSSYDLRSYQQLASPSTSVLSAPYTPFIHDNIHQQHHNHNHDHNQQHAAGQDLFFVGNNVNIQKGLNDYKESSIHHSEKTKRQQHRGLESQGIKDHYHHKQRRHSVWSLPDEEDDTVWDHPQSPSTQSFGSSSPNMSRSAKTFSADSGYGTSRSPSSYLRSPQHTVQLSSLFDPLLQQEQQPSQHAARPLRDINAHLGSLTDDDDDNDEGDNHHDDNDDNDNDKAQVNSTTTSSHIYHVPTSLDRNQHSSNSITKGSGKESISSRLSSISFGGKFSLRQKTPFHMRYQEWTETRLNNSQTHSTRSTKPSVINIFPSTSQDPSITVHSSLSSPLLSKSQQRIMDTITPSDTENHTVSPPGSPTLEGTNSRRPSLAGSITRRKSTGTLVPQKPSVITRASSDIVCQQDNFEMIDDNGQVTAKYKLGNVIGKGQFGVVYRALELRTGKMVAVKRIKLNSSKKKDILDVMQEAQLLQQLSHPNIVKYEGLIQTEGHVNIILEYVENGSLLNTLKSFGSFPENLVASYCTRVLHGLQYLHDRNVVHCDLKAANLLTTKSGHVKLSDFGVSLNLRLKENEVGAVAGTPNWMAPEVIELKGASTKSDIWSLGCTIVELCTGKPPYSDLLPMTALFRIVEDDYPPLPSELSPALCDFLQSCFAKNPDDRPAAKELLLHSWIRTHQQEATLQLDDENISLTEKDDGYTHLTMYDSTPLSILSTELATAPNTPRDLDDTDNDFPPWIEPNADGKQHNRSSSVLADKFQQLQVQLQQQQLQHQNQQKHLQHQQVQYVAHRYVKGTFPKGAVRCKSCQLPIKKGAFICEECGFICHDKCKSESTCQKSTYVPTNTGLPTPFSHVHGQPSPTLSYTQEPAHGLAEPLIIDSHRSTSHQHKRRSDSSYSIHALFSSSSTSHYPQQQALYPTLSSNASPKPRNSVSTQLRQRTRKLSRVFSSRMSTVTAQQPQYQHTQLNQVQNSHQNERLPYGSKSCDALRLIQEEPYHTKKGGHAARSSSSSTRSSSHLRCLADYNSSTSTCSLSSPAVPPSTFSSPSVARKQSQQSQTKRHSIRRDKLKRKNTNPDDCIIS